MGSNARKKGQMGCKREGKKVRIAELHGDGVSLKGVGGEGSEVLRLLLWKIPTFDVFIFVYLGCLLASCYSSLRRR